MKCISGFIYNLPGDAFRYQCKHKCARSGALDLIPDVLIVIREFSAQLFRNPINGLLVFNELDPSEDDDRLYIQCPFSILTEAFIIHAEGSLVMPLHGVDLVALFPSVEIELSILLAIVMADGHTVRIIIITQNGQDATQLCFQDAYALVFLLMIRG